MQDFKSMTDVLLYVKGALVIDLMPHVMAVDEDPFLKALVKPPEGLYLVGSIEPLVEKGKAYYPRSQFPTAAQPIQDLHTLSSLKDDIVNTNGDIVLTLRDLITKSKFIKKEPTVPVTALKAAVSVVEQYLTSVSRNSKRSHPRYRLEFLVKETYHDLIIDDEYMKVFKKLLNEVSDFVADDTFNMYYTKIKGTSLIIEKGIDFRIHCYYEDLFKSQETPEE